MFSFLWHGITHYLELDKQFEEMLHYNNLFTKSRQLITEISCTQKPGIKKLESLIRVCVSEKENEMKYERMKHNKHEAQQTGMQLLWRWPYVSKVMSHEMQPTCDTCPLGVSSTCTGSSHIHLGCITSICDMKKSRN